jgi:enoyl-CoA hydratase/carnithine racemase
MTLSFIKSETIDNVLLITMHHPETRNAIGLDMLREIEQELDKFEMNPKLRTLVLTGSDPSFCSGANVRNMGEDNQKANDDSLPDDRSPWDVLNEAWDNQKLENKRPRDFIEGVRYLPLRLHNLQKPSIAAVNGSAIGLGMGIALSCDIRIASDKAIFSEMFVRRGLIPADGSCWQLPRMIGLGNTLLLQYTGDILDAVKAEQLGIVNQIVSHDSLMADTLKLASRIGQGATYSMSLIKKLVHKSLQVEFEESLKLAGPAQELARRSNDHKEGVNAFIEKRQPKFLGR